MEAVRTVDDKRQSGTIRITLHMLTVLLVVSIFFMPDYFGILVLNVQRITLLLIWYLIFRSPIRKANFFKTILSFRMNWIILIYIAILLFTAMYRLNINTFLNPFVDQIAVFYTMLYLFKYEMTKNEFFKLLITIAYILCILGLFEYIFNRNIFVIFETIEGMTKGGVSRAGTYRIQGPAHHPLGYGLYLLLMLPIVCYDTETNEINPLKRIALVVLILVNVFLCGSRSTLGLLILEFAFIFLISPVRIKKQLLLLVGFFALLLGGVMFILRDTSVVQSIMISIANVADVILDTSYAKDMGVDTTSYELSEEYRKLLPEIFTLDWLNPWIGRGYGYTFGWNYQGFWISSIDNHYINQYIKVGYPGMIIQIILYLGFLFGLIRAAVLKHSKICMVLFTSCLLYMIALWWVDSLGTLDYLFVLFALAYLEYKQFGGDTHVQNFSNNGQL